VTLRDAAAAVVSQLNDPITLVSPLPEELRSLVAYKALPPSAALRLQVQSLSISLSLERDCLLALELTDASTR
jgi:hypothetical protein